MSGKMAEVADGFDEGHRGGDVLQLLPTRHAAGERGKGRGTWRRDGEYLSLVPSPLQSKALEHLTVEVVVALKQPVEPPQEHPRLRPLDDAVVVGRGDRHDLHTPDRADRAGRDDRALALHEAWYRGDGHDRDRV